MIEHNHNYQGDKKTKTYNQKTSFLPAKWWYQHRGFL